MRNQLILILLFINCFAWAQTSSPELYIAPFRYDAEGAYTLIHDDFGATYASGIESYADTIAFNRNLPICFATITGECDQQDWEKAREMIAHKHQILNHTMSHKCGQPIDWCTDGNWDEKDFAIEIDKSTELIIKNTGKHPAFFVFPFDLFTDTMLHYLKAKNYLGARAGDQNVMNSSILMDPFRCNFTVFRPEHKAELLSETAEEAIENKSWAIQVLHGVEDESWGKISVKEYSNHLNYLQKKVQQRKLWMATLSDVVTYQYNKEAAVLHIAEKNNDNLPTLLKVELKNIPFPSGDLMSHDTLTVVLKNLSKLPKTISQSQHYIPYEIRDNKIIFDINLPVNEIVLTY